MDISEYFKYLGGLRYELVKLYKSVQDACEDIQIDHTKPNWKIRKELEQILNLYLPKTAEFGFYIVEKHQNCRLPKIIENEAGFNELLGRTEKVDIYGLGEKLLNPQFIWTGRMVDCQNISSSKCDCTLPLDHNIIREVVHVIDAIGVESQAKFWSGIYSAKDCSKDGGRRSAIRERLLLVILEINKELHRLSLDGL